MAVELELDLEMVVVSHSGCGGFSIQVDDLVPPVAGVSIEVHDLIPVGAAVCADEDAFFGIIIPELIPPKIEEDIGLTGQVDGQDGSGVGVDEVGTEIVQQQAVGACVGV